MPAGDDWSESFRSEHALAFACEIFGRRSFVPAWEGFLECLDDRNRRIALKLHRFGPCISRKCSDESEQGSALWRTRSDKPAPILIGENRYVLHCPHIAPTEQCRLCVWDSDLSTGAFGALFQAVTRARQITGIIDCGRLIGKVAERGSSDQKNERKLHCRSQLRWPHGRSAIGQARTCQPRN